MAEIALSLGGGVLSAFLQVLFDKLSSPVLQHFGFLWKVEDKLKSLAWTLSKIQFLVAHAESISSSHSDPALSLWLRELKIVACDAEDVLDDFAAETQSNYDIGKKISDIQKRLSDIASDRRDLATSFHLPPSLHHLHLMEWRATSSLQTEGSVFGRDGDTQTLVSLLLRNNGYEHLSVLPIVGMGGLGKTTLARTVYNDPRIERHFQLRIWICVSSNFSVRRITEEMVDAVSHERYCGCSNSASLNKLQSDLRWKLSKKRFLLVLDDLWSENQQEWDRLCAPLKFGEVGSKIVITTRSRRVGDVFGADAGHSFLLNPLQENDSWELFKSCAFAENSVSPIFEEIGRKIVRRLKGVPLAAKTIGGLLCSNTDEGAWMAVLDSQLWRLPQYENDIIPVLRLSYQQMPAQLKMCFMFCSLFPKDSKLARSRMLLLWMAQGFVQPHEKRRLEEIGGEYFDDLVNRSFFQRVDDEYFVMNDLIHDLAQSIAADECIIIDGSVQWIPEKILHCSLHFDSSFEFEDLYKHRSLRTLLYLERSSGYNFNRVPKELFENLKYIRVLDLRYSHIVDLPDSIGLLKHLRYLDLSFSKISCLCREVGELCNLQTIQLVNCNELVVLPECLKKLINLRTLKGKSALLSKFAGIGNLKSLQELDKFEVSGEIGRNIGELKDLSQLHGRLCISNIENVSSGLEAYEASLINKQYIHMLELEWGAGSRDDGTDYEVLESLKPHPELKDLKIKCNDGACFPSWLEQQYLAKLENVSLVKCQRWKVLPLLKKLRLLKGLEIGSMSGLDNLLPEFWSDNGFQSLQKLKIFDMLKWTTLGGDRIHYLHTLEISNCPELRVLPSLPQTLKELKISEVGLVALPKVWGCDGTSSSSPFMAVQSLSSLFSITISCCPNLISLSEGLLQQEHCSLRSLEISSCENLLSLPAQGFRRHMLSSLIIENCPLLAMLPDEGGLPPSLHTLKFLSYTNLIPLGHSLFNQLHDLTSLTTLSILTSPNLISLPREVLISLGKLEMLTITDCRKLKTLGIQALSSLKNLVVTSCPLVMSLTDGPLTEIPLRSISIRDCAGLRSLPEDLRILKFLEELSIKRCPRIRRLPDTPASLRTVELI